MNPLIPNKILYASLFAVLALMLAAPAGARPILDGDGLGDTSAAVAPDAFERAVTSQAPQVPLWEQALIARSKAMNEFYAAQASQTPAWEKALMARSQAMNEFYADTSSEPAWLKALNARSEAMNAYYGALSTGVVRPDDRGTPRPMQTGTVVTAQSSDGTAWQDVSVGALGGFGIALLIGLGGFALVHSRRQHGTIAH
jgi:hypothetical protein